MDPNIQAFSVKVTKEIIPEVENIVELYKRDPEKGFNVYSDFVEKWKKSLEIIILEGLRDPAEAGHISSRLLRDPGEAWLMLGNKNATFEEREAHVVGYLKAILSLFYCGSKGLEGWQFIGTPLHKKTIKTLNIWKVDILTSFLQIIKDELDEIEIPEGTSTGRGKNVCNEEEKSEILNKKVKTIEKQNFEYLYDQTDVEKTDVPFTARLMAYYRAQECRRDSPLIVDPFAEDLAGDMFSYTEKHEFVSKKGDYPLVRSYYIEQNLLTKWCCNRKKTQIVLLGAGLDTRAYRFPPVKMNDHTIFEIDFLYVINYKEKILRDKKLLCNLRRVPADLSQPDWTSHLIKSGYSFEIPTFWILEGLVYYVEQNMVISLLTNLAEISHRKSKIFVDVCVPALADLVFGPFTRYFKWGLNKKDITSFFVKTGWNVSCSYADDHDQGRDVGQRGLIFVHGDKL
jgi:methyltransferase (TIGR00027 family)